MKCMMQACSYIMCVFVYSYRYSFYATDILMYDTKLQKLKSDPIIFLSDDDNEYSNFMTIHLCFHVFVISFNQEVIR